jgi:seryl-tRNA synthetase
MFALYRGQGARLIRALTQLALDRHTSGADSYEEIRPPTLVRTDTMIATGQLPKFADDAYKVERDDLWLIPTAEAPLTSMHRDEIVDEADLPLRFTAYTPCFRREAGSAGKDTRGTLRTHEFDKVELFAYCTSEQWKSVHDDILRRALGIITDLGLPYRVLDLCAGDLGFSSARTFDVEVYAPGCDMWLEVSSVSWFSDYQARRANVRYRVAGGKGTETCHTLNGSAMAWSRIWPAIVETHRQPDGSIRLPEVLHPYFGGATAISRG